MLPVAGGVLAVVVGVLWYTSALWYYNGFHVPALYTGPASRKSMQVPVETPACGTPAVSRGAGIDLASGRQPFGRGTITL